MYWDKVKNYLKKLNYKCFVFIFMLLFGIMPILPRAVSSYLTTYSYMLLVVLAVLFTFVVCRLSRVKEFILFLLPFVLYELIVLLVNQSSDVLLAGYQVLLFILPVCLGFYLVSHAFFEGLYTSTMVVGYFVTGITTIIGCMRYPDAPRVLATTATSQDPTAILYNWMNIGGYNFVYSLVLLYPFVVLAFKMKRLHIVPTVLLTLLVYAVVINAAYTYAFMLLMLSTLLFFIPRGTSLKRFILLMIAFALAVFLFRATVAAILTAVGDFIGNSSMTDKMNALFLGKDAVENFDDDRGALYMLSVNTFLKNPLFGTMFSGRAVTGGHSFILDSLARYGLVGGVLMIGMYRGIFRTFIAPLKQKEGYSLLFWTFLQPILLSAVNTGMWLDNLCLYTPILVCVIYGHEAYRQAVAEQPSPLIPVTVLQRKAG